MIDKINSIPLENIFSSLGVEYKKQGGGVCQLYYNGKATDGWKADFNKGIVSDFSNKGRPSGDRIKFVTSFRGCSFKETLEWFSSTFGIVNKGSNMINNDNKIKEKWDGLEKINDEQIKYLESRGIFNVGEFVRNYKGNICLPIKTINGNIISLQSRSISSEGSRYYVEANTESDGLFFSDLDENKKAIIVVEGFTDFLTLRQHTTNVVGLLNAKNEGQLRSIKILSNTYEIYFIPDNDEAGAICLEKLKALGVKMNIFSLSTYGVKDVNELINTYGIGKEILNHITNEAEKPKSNLSIAFERAKQLKEKGIIYTGDKVIDDMTRGLMRGSTFLINGASGQGKTTFSIHLLRSLLKHNPTIKINYYSLETDVGRQIMQIIAFVKGVSEEYVFNNLSLFEGEINGFKGLEIYDDIRSLEEIKKHIEKGKPDVAFVDFCQKVTIAGMYDETQKSLRYAQEMQDFAIQNKDTAIISLSQVNMGNYNTPILERMPKSSGALKESSDTMVNIGKDENGLWKIGWIKAKNIGAKGWYKVSHTNYDYNKGEYIIFPPDIEETKKETKTVGYKSL